MKNILGNVSGLFKFSAMSMLKNPLKRAREPGAGAAPRVDNTLEVALAAIVSSKRQKEVSEFINFLLASLEKNSTWLDSVVSRQTNFRCALMVGAGPNRFQLQEIIYPAETRDLKFEVELKDSEDHDKIAIAALVQLNNSELNHLLQYLKTRLHDNLLLRDDLLKGKAMGVSFAVLRPFTEKQYRLMERIVIGSSMRCVLPVKKRQVDRSLSRPPLKKIRRLS